ncbi:MAG: AmmeMemoRadiSam system radical SAM enzyme [Bacteroidota bacterium]
MKQSLLGLGGIIIATNSLKSTKTMASNIFNMSQTSSKTEAKYYKKTDRGYECELCPNFCILKENKLSSCRTRIAESGKLYTIAYSNPCSVHVDPIEKKPLYHFYPASKSFSVAIAGCNLHCLNCQNYSLSQASPTETRNYQLCPPELIKDTIDSDCKSIAYTYSDPVAFYEYAYDSAKLAREKGIKNVFISAGYINEKPLRDIAKYLDAANIDLKSFSDETYKKLNAGSLKPILDCLKILHSEGVWLEITNLIVPQWSDDMDEIKEMCDWLYDNDLANYPLHFSRFFPVYKLKQLPPTPVDSLNKAREIAMKAGIKYVYIGNVPGTEAGNTYCPKCKKLLVERKGYTITKNDIEKGLCKYCNEKIAGHWE